MLAMHSDSEVAVVIGIAAWVGPLSTKYGAGENLSMTFIKLTGIFALFVSVALCQVPATLAVQGIGGTSATLSISDLSKLPQQTVKVTDPRNTGNI